MKLTIEVAGIESLGTTLAKINRLPNIINASRVQE